MANVFHNPYANQTPVVWSLQNCFIYAQATGGSTGIGSPLGGILASVQGVQIQFSRQLSKRYPLTNSSPITIVGVPQGTCQLTTIMGPNSQVTAFLNLFSSVCTPFQLQISNDGNTSPDPSCRSMANTKQHFKMKNCTGQAITVSLTMQNNIMVAQGVFNIQFDVLDWDNK